MKEKRKREKRKGRRKEEEKREKREKWGRKGGGKGEKTRKETIPEPELVQGPFGEPQFSPAVPPRAGIHWWCHVRSAVTMAILPLLLRKSEK